MKTNFATPYDQNPTRIAMVARNIRRRGGFTIPRIVGTLASLQLAALFVWNTLA